MRAVRVTRLRRTFFARHGRYPQGCAIQKIESRYPAGWRDLVKICRSRFKKMVHVGGKFLPKEEADTLAGEPLVFKNVVAEMFLRRIGDIIVLQRSEWRQLKKKYLRDKAAGR